MNTWVIGDIMLDVWVQGAVERISPEAPVPVLWERDTRFALGGAANVAKQMRAWGCEVSLAGVLGNDEDAQKVFGLCAQSLIKTRSVVCNEMRPTTRKTRAVAHGQQLIRIDRETREPFEHEWSDLPAHPKVIVLSDYGKGVMTDAAIARFRVFARECPVIVDPKRKDLRAYAGCTVLTPNLKELCGERHVDVMDHDEIERVAADLIEAAHLEAVLVTLGEWGMLLVHRHWSEYLPPFEPEEVVDATGAGDVAVAVFAAELAANGRDMLRAARVANRAAGMSVHKHGVQTVRKEEL